MSHRTGYDEQLHEVHADRFARLKLASYGITFEQYLEDPFGYETVLALPLELRKRLMAQAGQESPLGELIRKWNVTTQRVFELEEENEVLRRRIISAEQAARVKEMEHAIAWLRGVGNIQGSELIAMRLNVWRNLRRKDAERHAKSRPHPLATETQAQP